MTEQISYSRIYFWCLFKSLIKLFLKPYQWKSQIQRVKLNFNLLKIAITPRYTPVTVNLFDQPIEIVDSLSFFWIYYDIFGAEIYKFSSDNFNPLIIDCGANIGLSILYFKQLYPNSKIIAFEPDINIFCVLQKNVQNFNFSDTKLLRKALWNSETILEFISEGGDSGRLSKQIDLPNYKKYEVETVRLREYLNQTVDLLKIDIEGAETKVIEDCSDLLFNVKKIFVEYHSFVDEPQSLNVLINILSQAGFRFYIQTVSKSIQPLFKREVYNKMDMQLNIFAWRES